MRLSYIRLSASYIAKAVIFGLRPSDIAFGSFGANIIKLKPKVLISLLIYQKYHCETRLTISLIIFIFEIGEFLKYITHYDTFNPNVSFLI